MGEIILNRLPRTLEELKEMPQAGLTRPGGGSSADCSSIGTVP